MRREPLLGLTVWLLGCAPLLGQQPSQPAAHHSDASVAFRVSTTGFGGEVAKQLTGHLAARIGGSFYSFSTSKSQSEISYDASLKLHAFSALINFSPGARGSFHLATGFVTNPMTIAATGVPAAGGTFKINGHTYTSQQVGTLTLEGKFPSARPYLGFGFGTPANTGGGLAPLFDLGFVLGKPTITLNATGAASNPQLAADLMAQEASTQHDVRKYLRVYPVVSLGLGYRF
jgi:hypothetical protein